MTTSRRGLVRISRRPSGPDLRVALAQDPYPSRPVRIVVAYPPGGAVDTIARKMAQKLSEQMGQQFVVENKPGASGTIGAREVARAEPDGYTLLAIDNSYAMLPYVFAKLPWDHATDLVPITVSAFSPIMVVVGEGSRFADLGGCWTTRGRTPRSSPTAPAATAAPRISPPRRSSRPRTSSCTTCPTRGPATRWSA